MDWFLPQEYRFSPTGMNLPMLLMLHLASGRALFVGVALLLGAWTLLGWARRRGWHLLAVALVVVGFLLTVIGGTPGRFPWFGSICLALALLTWIVSEDRARRLQVEPAKSAHAKRLRGTRIMLVVLLLALATWECVLQRPPALGPRTFSKVYVIGDSISAGIGGKDEQTWPLLLAQQHGLTVENLAMAGAEAPSALERQAPKLAAGPALVILEIGGNDMLYGKSVTQYAAALDALLTAAQSPDRQLVMLELPAATPRYTRYLYAQRRIAALHDVPLIPRKYFVDVLTAPGATLDGAHLTPLGHQRMAAAMSRACRPALTANPE